MKANPKDPLLNAPLGQRELWEEVVRLCDGYPPDFILTVGFNLLINMIRQTVPTQKSALDFYDEITTKMRAQLAGQYGVNGVRRNIFPFDQHLTANFTDFSKSRKW